MTGAELETILKTGGAKADKEGWWSTPEGRTMTLHVAHAGASTTVPRVEAIKFDATLMYARNPKRELFAAAVADVFAVAFEAEAGASSIARRAGFG